MRAGGGGITRSRGFSYGQTMQLAAPALSGAREPIWSAWLVGLRRLRQGRYGIAANDQLPCPRGTPAELARLVVDSAARAHCLAIWALAVHDAQALKPRASRLPSPWGDWVVGAGNVLPR